MKKLMALVIAISMLTSYASMSMSASAAITTAQENPSEYSTYYHPVATSDEVDTKDTLTHADISADFNYVILEDDTVEIMYYKGESGNVIIPSKIEGKNVTAICDRAFMGCKHVTNITIPDTVTFIGNYAFSWCENLTSITIPSSVTFIGKEIFPSSSDFTSINVDENNKIFSSLDGVLFNKEQTQIITCPAGITGEYFIPDSVTSIGEYAFMACQGLTNINIPNSVTSIGEWAFYDCNNLTSINIPNTITSISEYTFANCDSLTSITIPNSVTSIGDLAFDFCYNLTSITLSNNLSSIGNHTFSNCDSLTSITIPDSVTSIGHHSFASCDGLTSVIIPDSVISIGDTAFIECRNLTNITISNNVTSISNDTFAYCDKLTSVIIPDSVTSIGERAFAWCDKLTSVIIPDSVTSIGEGAFKWCDSLRDIYYSGTEKEWNNIQIDNYNYSLYYANIHFNWIDTDTSTDTETEVDTDTSTDTSTDTETEVDTDTSTDTETDTPSGVTGTFFFDASEWGSEKVYFYIWDETDGTYATKDGWGDERPWGSKKIAGTPVEGSDYLFESYEIEFKDDHDIFVIFHDPDKGKITYDIELCSSRVGQTAKPVLDTSFTPTDNPTNYYAEFSDDKNDSTVGTFFFDASEWGSEKVYFYIWDETEGTYATKDGWVDENPWGSKKTAGTPVEGKDCLFESFEIEFKDNHDIFVIFYDPNIGIQTYECVLNSTAIGDTAYISANVIDEYFLSEVRFDNAACGTRLQITAYGNIVGEYIAPNTDCPKQVAEFVYKYYGETENITGYDVVTVENVARAIEAFNTNADDVWAKFQEFEYNSDYDKYNDIKDGAKDIIYGIETPIDTPDTPDVPVDPIGIYGDMTGDGRINTIDALYVQRFTIGYSELTDTEKLIADVNLDGRVNSIDTLTILRYCAGYTDDTNVGKEIFAN